MKESLFIDNWFKNPPKGKEEPKKAKKSKVRRKKNAKLRKEIKG